MPGFDMHDFIGPVKALEKMNIKPEDITDVIITHSHHDHVECVSRFKNAVIYIQRDEYESGRRYFSEGMSVRLFDDEIQICPDVKAIKIGGHTKGSCIVEIGENREKYIIAGDECYMRECLDKRIPTGSSYCPKKSREFIEKYSGSEYTVMLCHDK
jgi:glyoxylase-like metal-dependent hydrolase (beta-lactamase superfamily II)